MNVDNLSDIPFGENYSKDNDRMFFGPNDIDLGRMPRSFDPHDLGNSELEAEYRLPLTKEETKSISQDSGGGNSSSSLEIACADIYFNSSMDDNQIQVGIEDNLSILKNLEANEECSGLFRPIVDSMHKLIQVYCDLTGINHGSFKDDILKAFNSISVKEKRLSDEFAKKFDPKKEKKWNDKDAITKKVGSFIKKIPIILLDQKDYFQKRNHSNRKDTDFFAAYLKVFMLEFIPIFLVKKREYEEDFDSLIPHSEEMMFNLFLDFIVIRYPQKRVEFILNYFLKSQWINDDKRKDLLAQRAIKPTQNLKEFCLFSNKNTCLRLLRSKSNSLFNTCSLAEKQIEKIQELFLKTLD